MAVKGSEKMSANVVDCKKSQIVRPRARTSLGGERKRYYLTTGRKVSEEAFREMESEILKPYKAVLEVKSMDDVRRYWENERKKKVKEKAAPHPDRHTYRSRVNLLWKSERLFVPDDAELPGSCMTDIDPNFFRIVSGRPIGEKTVTRAYLKDLRDCFLTRLKIGYCLDEILLMDERHLNERRRLGRARGGFLSALKGFEAFLKEDHDSSSSLLESAKEEERNSRRKLETVNGLREELRRLQADVSVVEEEWRNLRMFQKFLYRISPTEWRKAHDPYYGREDGESPEDGLEVREGQPPALYFTDPEEIVGILAELEKNNLRALTQCRDLDFPAESLVGELEKRKAEFQREQTRLEEEVKYLRDSVEAEEKHSRQNEAKMKEIAFGLFRDLITNEDYLTVTSYLEDAYEDALAPPDPTLSLVAMIKDIELKHETLLLALDMLPNNIVTTTTRQFYRAQRRQLREAKQADKKVRQMELLLKRLSKSLSYPKKGVKERKVVPRSLPPEELMFRFRLPRIPSKEQREQVFFFGKAPDTVTLHRPLCL